MNPLLRHAKSLLLAAVASLLIVNPVALQAVELVGVPVGTDTDVVLQQEHQTAPAALVAPVPAAPSALSADENKYQNSAAKNEPAWVKGMAQGWGGGQREATAELLIPIFAIVFLFGGPIFLIGLFVVMHFRAQSRRQQAIDINIDKLLAAGRDIPVELLRGIDHGEVGAKTNLHKGIKNLCLGVGWLLFLTLMFGIKIGAIGFIIIGLGLSRIIIWKLSSPQSTAPTEQQG